MTTTPAAFVTPPPISRQAKIFTLIGMLLGLLLAALDNTIVATAGPSIQRDLAIAPSLYTWITTAYLVASTVMIPIYGKLSDLLGRKSVLVFGVVVFLLGSALCGVSESAWFIILARAIQGVGSAALFTSAFSIIADLYPPAERGRITGLFGAVFGLSSVLGPLVGGFITDHFSWHWAFFINLPLGLIALFFIVTRMPALKHAHLNQHGHGGNKPRVDYLGALWLMVGVIPLLLGLSLGKTSVAEGDTGFLWNSWQEYGLFGLALIGVVAFLLTERRAQDPILDLRLFRNRVFALGNLGSFIVGGAFLGPIIFLPLFMVNVVGLSATNSGLTITPLSLGIVAGNILTGQIVSRIGKYKPLMMIGLLVLMVAFAVMAFTLNVGATQASVTLKMVLLGLGLGPSIPLYTLAIQNAVEPRQTGVATSSATFFRQLGNVVGVAVLGTVFAGTLTSQLQDVRAKVKAELPPAAQSQFSGFRSGGEGSGGGSFDVAKIKRTVANQLDAQKVTVTKALRDNDPAAVQKLLANAQTPAQLREVLQAGGIEAQVHAGFQAQRAILTKALRDNDPASVQALLGSAQTPPQLRALLQANAPAPVKTQALNGALSGLTAAEGNAVTRAKAQAVQGAVQAIDDTRAQILRALDTFGDGFKASLTRAIRHVFLYGLLITALGFLASAFIPQIPLRKRAPGAPPAPAMD